jgi:hypothetical protein
MLQTIFIYYFMISGDQKTGKNFLGSLSTSKNQGLTGSVQNPTSVSLNQKMNPG